MGHWRCAQRGTRAVTWPIHVVFVHPEIHWNTGNAGRTCLAAGATLHLIEPLGFSLDERQVRRAGLDYWEHVDVRVWPDWAAFEAALPALGNPYLLLDQGDAGLLGCAARCGGRRRVDLWKGNGRPAARTARALSRPVRRHADAVAAGAIAQPVDDRRHCRLRSIASAARWKPGGECALRGDPHPP